MREVDDRIAKAREGCPMCHGKGQRLKPVIVKLEQPTHIWVDCEECKRVLAYGDWCREQERQRAIEDAQAELHNLRSFYADVMAGCDIGRGGRLYRQCLVGEGGVTKEQQQARADERRKLIAEVETILKAPVVTHAGLLYALRHPTTKEPTP